jgi:rod shape-determining protein MreB
VIALGGTAYSGSVRVGGDNFDAAIVKYVRNVYGVLIGEQTAEHLKRNIGTAVRDVPLEQMDATGRSADDGLPRTVRISNHDIAEAIEAPLAQVIGAVKRGLELAPAELVTDIADSGIVLTGGGALLANLARRMTGELAVEVRVAEEPLTCAVRGAGVAAATGWADEAGYD